MRKLVEPQELLFDSDPIFPRTRYQGSKLKILDWIWDHIKDLKFETTLDAFGGTGSVAYMLKAKGKHVTYNNFLKFNWHIGNALIENSDVKLSSKDVDFILTRQKDIEYSTFIFDNFHDIYYADDENEWLDIITTNINAIDDPYKKSLAFFALFQACIIKRPFNLFHRKNLYIRFSDVERNFGNKTTWDTPFESHFIRFVEQANQAVFSNDKDNIALNLDIFDAPRNYDLVYIDTPYLNKKGTGVDYHGFYHFLEGLVDYPKWGDMIDYKSKHRKLHKVNSAWNDKKLILNAFDLLFEKFKNSILVVSYRSDGIPSISELEDVMRKYKDDVKDVKRKKYKYVLSNKESEEVLVIGI